LKLCTLIEHWLVCPMHVLWKYTQQACDKPECLRCVLAGKRPPQLWRYTGLLGRCARRVDQFVSPSRFTAKMHADRGFSRPVEHLPYFIPRADGDWQSPAPRPHERPYFLFVGRLELIKGLQTLIALWNRVPGADLPNADLLVAGSGTFEPQLRAMAAGNPRIRFLGPLSQKQLGAVYHHALACIVPSITYETFGIIIVEAFARKTPVIVRDLGALPEVVYDGDGGYVYRTDDELLDAMHRIESSADLRGQLGENGYRAFVEQWSPEAHQRLYFGYLERIALAKYGRIPWVDYQPSLADSRAAATVEARS
jgi:glycosyltransferase involved in cell wall biosynthesis